MTGEKSAPQCQARFKNNKRCQKPAEKVLINEHPWPVFFCNQHAETREFLGNEFSAFIDASMLPDYLLAEYLEAMRRCYEKLSDESYLAERRLDSARKRLAMIHEEINKRGTNEAL